MALIDKDQIRAEIERLKEYAESAKKEWNDGHYNQNAFAEDCRINSFNKLLSFLDTLQEQPVEGLEEEQTCKGFEEEFRRFIKKEKEKEPDGSLPYYGDYGIYRIARHFAEWGAKHLK